MVTAQTLGESLELYCSICQASIASATAIEILGFIYVLTNPRMIDLYKIGVTEKDPKQRAHEISSATGVPEPYEVLVYYPSTSPMQDERAIHLELGDARSNPAREFFSGDLPTILESCKRITGFDPVYLDSRVQALNNPGSFDPWLRFRQKQSMVTTEKVVRVVVERVLAITPTNTMKWSYKCPRCAGPLKKAKKAQLVGQGVFAYCTPCKLYVNNDGCSLRGIE
ncbi:GIY-YIG nuclease family protein [Aeoliella sp. SH292]|uniref:GIY-YIG nuclease family protein n=1 Tax=Aeoliella sp. SH292 TaxID=3454464 RepID=UPI003F9E8CE1